MALTEVEDRNQDRARRLLDEAAALAWGLPANFVTALFGRTAPEDLTGLDARTVAELTTGMWDLLAQRTPGQPKIRIASPGGALSGVSIVEMANDDKPFLFDSVMGEISEQGFEPRLVAHPVMAIARNADGRLEAFGSGARESVIHIHIERLDENRAAALIAALSAVLTEVGLAVSDWRAMLARVDGIIADYKAHPPPLPAEEVAETLEFLQWLSQDNFTFLGVRDDAYDASGHALIAEPGTALGILRGRSADVVTDGGERLEVTDQVLALLMEPKPLIVTKTSARSKVHRRVAMDLIGIKRLDAGGRLTGVTLLAGLFTSTAYTRSTRGIPYLRRKTATAIAQAGFDPASHYGKALANVLEHYPRDELFEIDDDTLFHFALAILQLDERPRLRVLSRFDRFERFASVLVFVARDRYSGAIRTAIGQFLALSFNGRVGGFTPFFPEGPLVRVHFIISRGDGALQRPAREELERGIASIVRTWSDTLADALAEGRDPVLAHALAAKYRHAFSAPYRETFTPDVAVRDIYILENLTAERPLGVDFGHRATADEDSGGAGLRVWSYDRPIQLSDRVPVLEHMGFKVVDENTYHVQTPEGGPDFWLHDMALAPIGAASVDLAALKPRLEATFIQVMRGGAENDGFNALTLAGGLMWRDVALLRTFSRYLRQIRVPFSQDYLWSTLVKHAALAGKLVDLFHLRFDPHRKLSPKDRSEREARIAADIDAALRSVQSLDEDRIVRHFVAVIQAAVRTNFYQVAADGRPKAEVAVKFDSRRIDGLPLPRPLHDVFVYSPRLEAVHLRFGKVARGGIRWSDRPQDFRTEVLGLVKAQQVKNAVIVPVGAKGGFVPKHLPSGNREAIQAEGIATYKIFMSTLLDITDNIGPHGIEPPVDVVRHDGDDPYLVVAADKGTATFSDTANGIARAHGFWLDDAFASGGSAGYDHKKMGITARGAWESVKRHFREMDVDISTTPFTVVGVGDMSGDVFGNGMLRERTIRLVAAFDHRDIFIDPDPAAERALRERQRLFDLPRSSWQDYDKSLISAGGGIYSRALKEIELSPPAQAALGFAKAKATPQEIMNAILKAPVDLLFFGGIGTYVRASSEGDEAAGDRANDVIRAAGADLRCKVIGEGANLGMTQRGRIEAGLRGIRLNTDAIDNSAGVNTSDVEVNLKIALSRPLRDNRLDLARRDDLLAGMTDEVAKLVLRNNYQQTLALSLAERRGLEDLGFQQRLIQTLEARKLLDRAVEFLPDDMELTERRRRLQPLTRPELAVLLAYAKLSLHDDLLASAVPDDPYLGRELGRYFPATVASRFPDALEHHRLRREIIATQLANSMINRGGPTLPVRIADQTGAGPAATAAAFAAVRDSYGMTALNTDIEALDNGIPGRLQLDLFIEVQDVLLDRLVWFLRNVDLSGGLADVVDHYRAGIAAVAHALDTALTDAARTARVARIAELKGAGVPEDLARRVADLPSLIAAPDIVLVADRTNKPVGDVTATYFSAGAYFQLDRVVAAARGIKVEDYFDRLALDRSLDAIGDAERRIAADMMRNGFAGSAAVDEWVAEQGESVTRVRMAVHEIAMSGLTLSKLSVAASMLGDLARG